MTTWWMSSQCLTPPWRLSALEAATRLRLMMVSLDVFGEVGLHAVENKNVVIRHIVYHDERIT